MTNRSRTNRTLRALAAIDLFRFCDADQLATLLPNADVVDISAGTVIAHAGTSAQQFVGIVDGFVEALDEWERTCVAALDVATALPSTTSSADEPAAVN